MMWTNDVKQEAGSRWKNTTQNRDIWKEKGEAYIRKWRLNRL